MKTKASLLLPGTLVVILLSGCGSGNPNTPSSVSGYITYKDQPVKGGTIAFYTEKSGLYTTYIKEDGSYSIKELPSGEMKVTIETDSANPNVKIPKYNGGSGSAGPAGMYGSGNYGRGGAKPAPIRPKGKVGEITSPEPDNAQQKSAENYVKIPARYRDQTKSNLSATLVSGSNTKDFALTD